MATVFLNGTFVEASNARISAFDAGFQHAVGLFETMLAVRASDGEPRIVSLGEHLDRLIASARELGLAENLRRDPLGEAVLATVARSELTRRAGRARVRLTITGGDLNLLTRPTDPASPVPPRADPTVMIVAQPATEYPDAMFERGVAATIADLRINPLDPLEAHKTLSYWRRLRELQVAASKRAGEALVFQISNHLAGGCVSNAFIVKDAKLITPIARAEEKEVAGGGVTVPSPVLPGVTRRAIINWAEENGIPCERRMISITDVLGADELFLTNSSWGVLPVVRVERENIASGSPGPLTARIRSWWLSELGPDGSL